MTVISIVILVPCYTSRPWCFLMLQSGRPFVLPALLLAMESSVALSVALPVSHKVRLMVWHCAETLAQPWTVPPSFFLNLQSLTWGHWGERKAIHLQYSLPIFKYTEKKMPRPMIHKLAHSMGHIENNDVCIWVNGRGSLQLEVMDLRTSATPGSALLPVELRALIS